mgnify:CR=1 FL=1
MKCRKFWNIVGLLDISKFILTKQTRLLILCYLFPYHFAGCSWECDGTKGFLFYFPSWCGFVAQTTSIYISSELFWDIISLAFVYLHFDLDLHVVLVPIRVWYGLLRFVYTYRRSALPLQDFCMHKWEIALLFWDVLHISTRDWFRICQQLIALALLNFLLCSYYIVITKLHCHFEIFCLSMV